MLVATIDKKLLCSVLALLLITGSLAYASEGSLSGIKLDHEITAQQLQQKMASGELNAVEISQFYLARIDALNHQGPSLHAIITTNPDVLNVAKKLDEERLAGKVRGPLHGIPVVLKDNIDTRDDMPTTAGALALAKHYANKDAFIVQKLREAGAVILAKANLSEWANFRSDYSSSGWSTVGGQTRNPYVLDRNTCGSSSGSAVSVAANLAPLAVGTETDGSIVCPSAVNGVVGIKPTVGLLSRTGIIPIAHSQDTAGPITKTVTDAAMLLGVMTGVDQHDHDSLSSKGKAKSDYTQFLNAQALQGARIGVTSNMGGFSPKTERVFTQAINTLKSAGATIIDVGGMPHLNDYYDEEYEVLLYEFKAEINAYLANVETELPVHSLSQLITFNEKHREQTMPHFGQEVLTLAETKGALNEQKYIDALAKSRGLARKGIDQLLQQHKLDAIVAPTSSPAWLTDHINADHFTGGETSPAAVSGYPSITVPMGNVRGLPVALMFIAGQWQEPTLISLAYAYEQKSRARIEPKYLPSLE